MDDNKIIELYFMRDDLAIEHTCEKYGRLLSAVSFNILGSVPDVEESVSDTYLQLWNSIPPNTPPNLSAYACKIARNISLNRLEFLTADKRGAGKTVCIIDEFSEVIPSNENIEEAIELNELTEAINRFLGTLPKEQRVVFIKRYWFFMTDDEIAKELSVTTTRIRTSLCRTRKKLKAFLLKEGYIL